MTSGNRILADIVRRGGGRLLNLAVSRTLPVEKAAKPALGEVGKSVLGGIAGAAVVRVATRSVPGAIVVGGGMLAKRLYDRRRARKAASGQSGDT